MEQLETSKPCSLGCRSTRIMQNLLNFANFTSNFSKSCIACPKQDQNESTKVDKCELRKKKLPKKLHTTSHKMPKASLLLEDEKKVNLAYHGNGENPTGISRCTGRHVTTVCRSVIMFTPFETLENKITKL